MKFVVKRAGIKGTVLFVDEEKVLYYTKGKMIYKVENLPPRMLSLPMTGIRSVVAKSRLGERGMRLFPRCATRLCDNTFLISYSGKVYRYNVNENTLSTEHEYCQGMNNPLSLCKIESVAGFPDCIAYGEYRDNENHTPLGIYERVDGMWTKAADFPYDIKHIHALVPDKENGCVYVLTGDDDKESGIWIAKNNFTKFEPWLAGEQKYRGCVAFPTKNGLVYATDTPKEGNALYFARKDRPLQLLYDMPGPCVYGTQKDGVYYFATSVEPDANLPSWRYKISAKPGPGMKDGYVHIIAGNLEMGFHDVAQFKKDLWPYRMFQFGNVLFPECDIPDTIALTPVAVCNYDNKALLMHYER